MDQEQMDKIREFIKLALSNQGANGELATDADSLNVIYVEIEGFELALTVDLM